MMPVTRAHRLLAIVMIVIWGSSYSVAKIGLQNLPPMLFMSLRFALAAIILLPMVRRRPTEWMPLVVYGILIGLIHFGATFSALAITDASTVIVVNQLHVAFSTTLAMMMLGERVTPMRSAGIGLAVFGVAVFAGGVSADSSRTGVLLAVVAAAAWATGTIWMKARVRSSATEVNLWLSLFAAPMLALTSLVLGEDWGTVKSLNSVTLASLLYQALVVVILGYGIWNLLVDRYDVSRISPLTTLVPLSGLVLARIMLGEKLSALQMIGGAVSLAGVAVASLTRAQGQPKALAAGDADSDRPTFVGSEGVAQ